MNNRNKVLIIIIVGLAVIAVLLWVFLGIEKPEKPKDQTEQPQKQKILQKTGVKVIKEPETKLTEEQKQEISVEAFAKSFVEKFGTYSNHSQYKSIKELLPYMTVNMADWVEETYLLKLNKEHDPDGFYYEISTIAPTAEILEKNENSQKIELQTQRTEKKEDEAPEQFRQDIILELIKANDNWKVDAAFWQDKE
ncbi:MAG TPA: hypothetical protein VKP03_02780 [Patescibacteria group bacterium]|nr:hypothetical protein [Patescibacteria group bacterium]